MSGNQTTCAACGAAVAEDENGQLPAQCPACGELLVVDDQAEAEEQVAEEQAEVGELEEMRIRRIVRDRRAQVRTRSYYLVVILACVIFAVQLAVRLARSGKSTEMIGYGAGAILLLVVGWMALGRYREYSRKMQESALPEPTTPPDFEGLSDGSHHERNLRNFGRYDRH